MPRAPQDRAISPLPAAMDVSSPDGLLDSNSARLIVNALSGRRGVGLVVRGRSSPQGFNNQDLHDQLLGAVCPETGDSWDGPPIITDHPIDAEVSVGGSSGFAVGVSSTEPVTYEWYHDGVLIAGSNSSSISITDAEHADAGQYRVKAINRFGSVLSNIAVLTVVNAIKFYSGRSTNTSLTGTQIQALDQAIVQSLSRTIDIPAGSGYIYLAVPESYPALQEVSIPPMPVVMAGPSDGYGSQVNGIYHKIVTVGGQPFRLYRSFNQMAGSLTIRTS